MSVIIRLSDFLTPSPDISPASHLPLCSQSAQISCINHEIYTLVLPDTSLHLAHISLAFAAGSSAPGTEVLGAAD